MSKFYVKLNDQETVAMKLETKRTGKSISQIIREGLGLYFAVQKELRKKEHAKNEEKN